MAKKNSRFDRRYKAIERAANRARLTPHEQLERLDNILGRGVGADKERRRLYAMMEPAPVRVIPIMAGPPAGST